MKNILFIPLALFFFSCGLQHGPKLITLETKTYIFTMPQDSITFNIAPPDSIRAIQYRIKYFAYWNDTLIDRGVKLSAREYNTHGSGEFHSYPLKFYYNKYKASVYFVKIDITFIGYKKVV
jgi:hypothetical protein